MRRSTHTILTVIAALAVAAPAAQARPAGELAPATGPQLTQGQLHRVDGNQPVALAPASPVEVAPVQAAPSGGTDSTPWLLAAVPFALLLAFGGVRMATHRTLIPHRHSQAHA
jgi:hypothetical protein